MFNIYLQLILLSSVFNRLKDVPGVSAPHLQTGHVTPVPLLDKNSCLHSCNTHITCYIVLVIRDAL